MFVKVTAEGVKNSFGRDIPADTVIEVNEQRGREMIRMDLAELVAHDYRLMYQNQVTAIKNKDTMPPPQERKRSWFDRLIGI